MKKLVLSNKLYTHFLFGCFLISFLLDYFVFKKSAPNFPVILRTNDFAINFLANRYAIWQIPILGMVMVYVNNILARTFVSSRQNLSKLFFSANIGIAVLVLLVSVQIYLLNR